MWVQFMGREDPLDEEMETHSSIHAWRILWTEPGGLQSIGSQRVGHYWMTNTFTFHRSSCIAGWGWGEGREERPGNGKASSQSCRHWTHSTVCAQQLWPWEHPPWVPIEFSWSQRRQKGAEPRSTAVGQGFLKKKMQKSKNNHRCKNENLFRMRKIKTNYKF